MRNNAPRSIGTRVLTLALLWVSTGFLLSASSCTMPGIDAGQPRAFDMKAYQKLGEDRRQNGDNCRVKSCQ